MACLQSAVQGDASLSCPLLRHAIRVPTTTICPPAILQRSLLCAIKWDANDLMCGLCGDSAQHIAPNITIVCLGVLVHTMLGAFGRTCQDTWPAVSRASASFRSALLRLHSGQDLGRAPSKFLQQPLSSFCVVSSSVKPILSGRTLSWNQSHGLVGNLP